LPRTKSDKNTQVDSIFRTRSPIRPLHLDSQNIKTYMKEAQKMDTNTKIWLL
jgi:hypothetical protein